MGYLAQKFYYKFLSPPLWWSHYGGNPHYQLYSCAIGRFVSVKAFTQRIYCAMPCASHREHSEINSYRLTVVPREYVGANLLEKDLGSEQLIPSDRTTKPSCFSFRKYCTISLQSFSIQPSLVYSKKHSCSVYNRFNGWHDLNPYLVVKQHKTDEIQWVWRCLHPWFSGWESYQVFADIAIYFCDLLCYKTFHFALVRFMRPGKFMQDTCFCTVSTKALWSDLNPEYTNFTICGIVSCDLGFYEM